MTKVQLGWWPGLGLELGHGLELWGLGMGRGDGTRCWGGGTVEGKGRG